MSSAPTQPPTQRTYTYNPYGYHPIPNNESAAPMVSAVNTATWPLVCDDTAYGSGNAGGSAAPYQQQQWQQQQQHQCGPYNNHAQAMQRGDGNPPGNLALAPFERTAVQASRNIAQYRERWVDGAVEGSNEAPISPSLPHLLTATSLGGHRRNASQLPWYPNGVPILRNVVPSRSNLLEFFLRVGYPLQITSSGASVIRTDRASANAADCIATLIELADQTASWFCQGTGGAQGGAMDRPQVQSKRSLPLKQLPSVVRQTVFAHCMTPQTAAMWLLRVYVKLISAFVLQATQRGQLMDFVPGTQPKLPQSVMEASYAMQTAIFQLQDNMLPTVRLSERPTHYGGPQGDDAGWKEEEPLEAEMKDQLEWRYLYLLFLRQAVALAFSMCLSPLFKVANGAAAVTGPNGSNGTAPPTSVVPQGDAMAKLTPDPPTSPYVLFGLMHCALRTRAAFDYYTSTRLYYHTVAPGQGSYFTPQDRNYMPPSLVLTSSKRVLHLVEKQWVEFSSIVIPHFQYFSTDYKRLLPALAHVIDLR